MCTANSKHWDSGTYYGDASGGEWTEHPTLRRVGVGLLKGANGVFLHGVSSNLPGSVQTVARGELFAFLLLLRHLSVNSIGEFVTDNLNVETTFLKGPQLAVNSSNCDLWEECFKLISDKSLNITVRWMPSHLKEGKKKRPLSVSDDDITCNDFADELANKAALRASSTIPKPIATNIIYYSNLVTRIQKRLATIIMHLPARGHNKDLQKSQGAPKLEKIADLVAHSKHAISFKNNRYFCNLCNNNFRTGDPGLRPWLKGSCTEHNPRDFHRPTKVNEVIHMGNSSTHHSHDIYNYRGIIYCNKCGNFGVQHFCNLARQCQDPKTAGLRLLRCIDKGQMPVGISEWPDANVP